MALDLDLAQHRHRIGRFLREVAEGVHHVEHGIRPRCEGRREARERRGAHIVAAGIHDDDRTPRLVAIGLRRGHGQLPGDRRDVEARARVAEHLRDEPHPGLFQKIAILVRAEVRVHDVHIGECHAVPGRGGVQGEVEGEVGLPHSVMPRYHRDRRQREREPRSLICRHQMSPSGVFWEA